jgi:hypothetical protein
MSETVLDVVICTLKIYLEGEGGREEMTKQMCIVKCLF